MTDIHVIAIDPDRLAAMRATGSDEHGNPFTAFPAVGWEPLRCCLRSAAEDESIALISYAAFTEPSPWREVGPVFVHAKECEGYPKTSVFPESYQRGRRLLRTYASDLTLDYDHIRMTADDEDVEAAVRELLAVPEVGEVHVRAAEAQCFAFAVRLADPLA
ncbi:DUF1203 domain-containing protein [Fodinicola feengrottensis]|uniref:DUF1203 domain-containing protein n=1 Tax=Fodinicola feengrottensis TaxID=435914 RepID=A0ABP4UYR4_9ACTN